MNNTIYNGLVFNLAWLVCVLHGSLVAVPVAALVVSIHLYLFSDDPGSELALALIMMLSGLVLDGLFIRSGLLVSPDGSLWPPLWLISLWALFSTTLNHSLKWFHSHTGFAMVVGGVAGAMTYLAGTRLTDFALRDPQWLTLAVMFIVWCGAFPVCLLFARTLAANRPVR